MFSCIYFLILPVGVNVTSCHPEGTINVQLQTAAYCCFRGRKWRTFIFQLQYQWQYFQYMYVALTYLYDGSTHAVISRYCCTLAVWTVNSMVTCGVQAPQWHSCTVSMSLLCHHHNNKHAAVTTEEAHWSILSIHTQYNLLKRFKSQATLTASLLYCTVLVCF